MGRIADGGWGSDGGNYRGAGHLLQSVQVQVLQVPRCCPVKEQEQVPRCGSFAPGSLRNCGLRQGRACDFPSLMVRTDQGGGFPKLPRERFVSPALAKFSFLRFLFVNVVFQSSASLLLLHLPCPPACLTPTLQYVWTIVFHVSPHVPVSFVLSPYSSSFASRCRPFCYFPRGNCINCLGCVTSLDPPPLSSVPSPAPPQHLAPAYLSLRNSARHRTRPSCGNLVPKFHHKMCMFTIWSHLPVYYSPCVA